MSCLIYSQNLKHLDYFLWAFGQGQVEIWLRKSLKVAFVHMGCRGEKLLVECVIFFKFSHLCVALLGGEQSYIVN
jgi:hypothetical protein